MFEWDDFRFFQAVKKAKTLKGAAALIATDQATVGRRLYALEEAIGTKLFEKRSNGYFLTQAGERISSTIDQIEQEFDGVRRRIAGDEEKLEGTIRIAAPGALANHLLIPGLKDFTDLHPGITLEFMTGPEVVNLAKREADIAIRLVKPEQQNLQVKKIGNISLGLYGAKTFFKDKKNPKAIDDIKKLPFIGLKNESMSEMEARFIAPLMPIKRYALATHAWSSVYSAIASGVGIGVLPDFVTRHDSDLEQLSILTSILFPVWIVVHPDLKNNARVRALIDEIKKIFEDNN